MRVLHVIDTLRGGGVETLLANAVSHVAEQGIELAVMHLHNEPDMAPWFADQGVPIIGICEDRFRYFRRSRREAKEQLDRALAFAKDFNPDVLHAHLECSYVFAPQLAKALGRPVVHTVHTARAPWQTSRQFKIAVLRKVILSAFRKSARVLCVGEGARQYLAQFLPGMAGEIALVENCVGDAFVCDLPGDKRFDYDIAMVGRLSPEKSHDLALRALSKLCSETPSLRMAIVGFGIEEDRILGLRDRLGLTANVDMLGRMDPEGVRKVLDRSRVFHMPSQFEGFGIAAAEALFRGLPTVLSDIPVFSHLFGRLPGVWLADVDSVDAHVEKLRLALADSSVHDHRDSLKRFTASHHVALLRSVYDEAIESSR